MKPILIDFVRRWKKVYILLGVTQLIADLMAPSFFALITVIYLGPVLLSFDLSRGTARTLRSLPIKRATLAVAWWIVGVVVPGLFFSVILGIACLLRGAFGFAGPISASQATLSATLSFLWCGISYYLLTQMSADGPGSTSVGIKNGLVAALWGASIGGGLFLFMKLPDHWEALNPLHWAMLVGGLALTCLGWFHSEKMVITRTTSAQNGERRHKPRDSQKSQISRSSPTGVMGLFRTLAQTSLRSSAVFIAMFIALQVFLRKQTADTIPMTIARIVRDPVTLYILSFMIVITGLQWLTAIRFLRSLPIRTSHLVFIIASLFIIPSLFPISALGIADFILNGNSSLMEWAKRAALFGSVILVVPGLLLRFGLNWVSYFFTLVPMFALAPLAGLLAPRISIPISLLLCSAGWTVGIWLIYNALTVRNQTYRQLMAWPIRPG
jgi:hypothetical protein